MKKFVILLCCMPYAALAQNFYLTGKVGLANYQGDLQAKAITFSQAKFLGSLGLRYDISPHFAARTSFTFSSLQADDKKGTTAMQARNLNFKTSLFDWEVAGQYNVFSLNEKWWTPYVFVGVSLFHYNPYTKTTAGAKTYLAPLTTEGQGFAPMQTRLGTRRIQMAAWSVGMAQRALDMMIEYAPQRKTFGMPLSERQAIQFWVAEAATKIHATRLMTYDCAWKLDQGRDVRNEISMIKWYATEMAYETVDRAMQAFGAMGMTKELPLAQMQAKLRTMRIYDGPTEVHKWVVARNLLGAKR